MRLPKTFILKRDLEEKTLDLLNREQKKKKEHVSRAESLTEKFNRLYDNGLILKNGTKEDIKKAAEMAYALGVIAKRFDEQDLKEHYAKKSIGLYLAYGIGTLDDAAPYHQDLEGVGIPEIMHEGVVKNILLDDDTGHNKAGLKRKF
ncbi:hypothetical protein FJZ53_00485 [Candidatus Woesearchaeota archaeon]|nr:hypothetical protein [Candidatus Woesearchaeota archaeon]